MLINSSPLPCWLDAKNTTVAIALIESGFGYEGTLEGDDIDYLKTVASGWDIGNRSWDNSIVVIFDEAVFSFNCHGESDLELRWEQTQKLIKSTLRDYRPQINHNQLELFAA
ncbi:hypothetical protein [Nodularia sp. UHCC 0506]|uniref:hypothetical protein n=1 Tax=Nodularia sp. UHCC 0506 TaxID=3110243 RepID=UPI002B21DC0B|nr:hypothetical protein [Nodularia sp. UHCC 0506]MEA5516566.1 hypothetical protein [Nodularia sp. UHCC 0506]